MAETLVLANFTIDSKGVVIGANQANKAVDSTKEHINQATTASKSAISVTGQLTTKLFSLASATRALGTAFGIGGIILTAANALKTFVSDLVASSTAFDRIKESAIDWYDALVKGETVQDRVLRKQNEIMQGTGVGSFGDQITKLKALQKAHAEVFRNISFGPHGEPDPLGFNIALQNAKSLDTQIDDILGKLARAGVTAEQLGQPGLAQRMRIAAGAGGSAVQPGTSVNLKTGQVFPPSEKSFDSTVRGLQEVIVKADIFRVAVEGNTEAMDNFISVGANLDSMIGPMKELNDAIAENQKAWFRSQEAIQQWKSLAADAAAVGIQSLSGVLLGTENLTRQWAANTLAAMVPVFLGYAAMGVVQGILGIEGGWAAAAKATIAAVAAAAASRALGGPGSNTSSGGFSGGGGGGRGGGLGVGGTRGASSIIINVQGSIIGTNPDSLARDLNRLIKTNQGDGAR